MNARITVLNYNGPMDLVIRVDGAKTETEAMEEAVRELSREVLRRKAKGIK
jgi:hypothetical protein